MKYIIVPLLYLEDPPAHEKKGISYTSKNDLNHLNESKLKNITNINKVIKHLKSI